MRLIFGVLGFAIALTSSACSSDGKPAVNTKGNATVTFINRGSSFSIHGEGGEPDYDSYGGTVSNGNGFSVSCKLSASGSSYSLLAHIESADGSVDIQGSNISAGAAMNFWKAGTTPEPVFSVDDNNDRAPTCTLATSQADTLLTVGSGTIFAAYNCPNVISPSNATSDYQVQGLFYFTGCSS
jgi:hypothetical protein